MLPRKSGSPTKKRLRRSSAYYHLSYCFSHSLTVSFSVILFGASDTSSNALARMLHVLSSHTEEQETLRQEIFKFREAGEELTYDRLMELPFLDAVCKETLRAYVSEYSTLCLTRLSRLSCSYPPVLSMDRLCVDPPPMIFNCKR